MVRSLGAPLLVRYAKQSEIDARIDQAYAKFDESHAKWDGWCLLPAPKDAILPRRMARVAARPVAVLLGEARLALGMSQAEFGPALGASHRTAQRWDARHATPTPDQLVQLASRLYPVAPVLAAEVAATVHETLESLGLQAPPPPPPPPAAAPPAPVPREALVQAVVCAAAEAIEVPPGVARAALRAGFRRAHELGLTVDELVGAMAEPRGEQPAGRSSGKNAARRKV